ncbi:MAG: hypothetical protein IJ881_10040, partial [Neisseriaceae bacterium]|nr:hypothetical protein [Neisseriaceae bacterium]
LSFLFYFFGFGFYFFFYLFGVFIFGAKPTAEPAFLFFGLFLSFLLYFFGFGFNFFLYLFGVFIFGAEPAAEPPFLSSVSSLAFALILGCCLYGLFGWISAGMFWFIPSSLIAVSLSELLLYQHIKRCIKKTKSKIVQAA